MPFASRGGLRQPDQNGFGHGSGQHIDIKPAHKRELPQEEQCSVVHHQHVDFSTDRVLKQGRRHVHIDVTTIVQLRGKQVGEEGGNGARRHLKVGVGRDEGVAGGRGWFRPVGHPHMHAVVAHGVEGTVVAVTDDGGVAEGIARWVKTGGNGHMHGGGGAGDGGDGHTFDVQVVAARVVGRGDGELGVVGQTGNALVPGGCGGASGGVAKFQGEDGVVGKVSNVVGRVVDLYCEFHGEAYWENWEKEQGGDGGEW